MMGDYFGALLRSAGVAPARAGDGGPRAPRVADIGVEVETIAAADGGTAEVQRGAVEEGSSTPSAVQGTRMAVQPAVAQQSAAPASPATQPKQPADAPEGALHPAVRAALHWVAADPEAARESSPPAPRRLAPTPAPQPSAPPSAIAQPASRFDSESEPSPSPRASAPPVGRPPQAEATGALADAPFAPRFGTANGDFVAELDVAFDPLPQREPGRSRNAAHPSAQRKQVEISIGSMHVRVDPPPPAVVAATPPPLPQPVPQRTGAVRSSDTSFARSRLPRF